MKFSKILSVLIFTLSFLFVHAQTEVPKGYSKGTIVLSDSSVVPGYFKERIRTNASVTLLAEGNKKKNYDGSELLGAEIGNDKFLCTKGDFFRIITDGELKFLQKVSDASFKPIYNGNQAVFANGTEGKPGDYFIYNRSNKQLKLITHKTAAVAIDELFAGCEEAINKAKSVKEDIYQLNDAVVIYNNRSANR
jgi:hypothetical protein